MLKNFPLNRVVNCDVTDLNDQSFTLFYVTVLCSYVRSLELAICAGRRNISIIVSDTYRGCDQKSVGCCQRHRRCLLRMGIMTFLVKLFCAFFVPTTAEMVNSELRLLRCHPSEVAYHTREMGSSNVTLTDRFVNFCPSLHWRSNRIFRLTRAPMRYSWTLPAFFLGGGGFSPSCYLQTTRPMLYLKTAFDRSGLTLFPFVAKFYLKVTDDVTGRAKGQFFDYLSLLASRGKAAVSN